MLQAWSLGRAMGHRRWGGWCGWEKGGPCQLLTALLWVLMAFGGRQLAVTELLEVSLSLQEGTVVGMPGHGARAAARYHFVGCVCSCSLACAVTLVTVLEPLLLSWAGEVCRAGGPGHAEGNVPACPGQGCAGPAAPRSGSFMLCCHPAPFFPCSQALPGGLLPAPQPLP